MNCPKDKEHTVVENEVMGKKFFYCRGCKDEVQAAPEPKKDDYPWWTGMQTYYNQAAQKQLDDQFFGTVANGVAKKVYGTWTFSGDPNHLYNNCGDPDCALCGQAGEP